MPSVSVVIPCRNGAAFLGQTLRSVLNQTVPPDEVLVVDDGSTDDSAAIARGFGPPVTVVAGEGGGAPAARTLGAETSSGERLMFLDADDLLAPGTLAALVARLDGGPDAAFAICPWDRYEAEGEAWLARPPTASLPRPGRDLLAAWLEGGWSPPGTILWTRAGFERSGGWDREMRVDQDGELVRRALARGVVPLRSEGGLLLYRRLPGGQVSLSGTRRGEPELRSRLDGLRRTRALLEEGGTLPRYRAALAAAFSAVAADAPKGSVVQEEAAKAARASRKLPQAPPLVSEAAARTAARIAEWRRPGPADAGRGLLAEAPLEPLTHGPLVSVIVPTFNRREATIQAVRSALGQRYQSVEVLVVDDGSTDGTAEALEALGEPRLRVLRQPNGGVARARNHGLSAARGAFLAFLDDDDAWYPDKLGYQVAALEAAPARYGFCHTAIELWDGEERLETRAATAGGDVFAPLLLTNSVHAPTTSGVVRREVYEAVGGFDPGFPAIEDWEWLVRVARLYHFLPVDRPLCRYDTTDDPDAPRRSRRFRANMAAREVFWRRNAHALRRAGRAHLFLMESARRELREPDGDAGKGRLLVLRALIERPHCRAHWPWLPYMAAPFALRRSLRRIDASRHQRRSEAAPSA